MSFAVLVPSCFLAALWHLAPELVNSKLVNVSQPPLRPQCAKFASIFSVVLNLMVKHGI